jgi:uncharacterized membrane protein YbhN (UPF0104 family)
LGGIITVFFLLLGLSLLGVWTKSATTLRSVQLSWLVAAAVLCATGNLIFNGIWASCVLLTAEITPSSRPLRSFFNLVQIGLLSLAGTITPMNLGTDVMRSMLGKKFLNLEISVTTAASILARECKLHASLLLIPILALAAGAGIKNVHGRLMFVLACLVGVSLGFFLLRTSGAGRLARKMKIENLTETMHRMDRRIGWKWRCVFYLIFAAGFVIEWQALRVCFEGLGIPPDFRVAFVCFGLLFFLSRIPLVPLGIGFVETAGYAWLVARHVPKEQAGALIIVWGFLRVAVPFFLAAGSLLFHPRVRRIAGLRLAKLFKS